MENEFIVGEKVYLRPLEPEDASLVAKCKNSPYVRETFYFNFPENIVQQRDFLKDLYKIDRRYDYTPFAIVINDIDKPIGITAFHRIDLVSRAAVFSIIICDETEWGHGYGYEVTKLMVEYGFEILNLNRIQLHVSLENPRGVHIYEKAGFVKEGVLRQAMYHYDRYSDFYVMGILREDYYKSKSKKNSEKTE